MFKTWRGAHHHRHGGGGYIRGVTWSSCMWYSLPPVPQPTVGRRLYVIAYSPFPSSQLCKRPYTIRIMDYGLLDREYTIEEATGFVSPEVGKQLLVIVLSMFVRKNKTFAFRMWGSPNRVKEDSSGIWLRWDWYTSTNVSDKLSFSIFMDCLEEWGIRFPKP